MFNFAKTIQIASKLQHNYLTVFQNVIKPINLINHRIFSNKLIKSSTSKVLQDLFKISTLRANCLLSKYKKLNIVSNDQVEINYRLLNQSGIPDKLILSNLNFLSLKTLGKKLDQLKLIPHSLNDTIYLIELPLSKLILLTKNNLVEDRINSLSKLLKLDIKNVCVNIVKRPFLISLDINHMRDTLHILEEYGIPMEDVQKDLWIFLYKQENIREKFNFARENNVEQLKTWMVRVQTEIFDRYIRRRTENKSILGDSSLIEYLCDRLQCDEATATLLINKHPALKGKSLKKMQEIIDFLYTQDYKPEHICRAPKILLHSVETTRNRLNSLKTQGIRLDSLHILTKSHKQYTHFSESFAKSKKANKN